MSEIDQIPPDAAQGILEGDSEAVYLDVRSVPEFEKGHPEGAYNVPIAHASPTGMSPNPDFVAVVKKHFGPDTPLVVGCKSGGRSQQACQILSGQGYTNLSNVIGGFGGSPQSRGWAAMGLPVASTAEEGRDWESLKG